MSVNIPKGISTAKARMNGFLVASHTASPTSMFQPKCMLEPVVIQNGPLKIRLPEDAEALLEVHNTNSAVNCLTHTLGDLAADEVVDGQRQSEQKHLSAVLRAGSPLEDWVQRVSDLRHGGVEMSAEGAICSSACGPTEPHRQVLPLL